MKIMLKLQFLTCKKYSEPRTTVENCIFSKLQFFKCTSIAIPLHIFAVWSTLSDETLNNLLFLNRYFKKSKQTTTSDKSQEKAEFKAPMVKPMSTWVMQNPLKAKTKSFSQKRKSCNDLKGKSSQKVKKRKIETSSDSEDYEEKDLVDDNSDGSLNLGHLHSDDETQMY